MKTKVNLIISIDTECDKGPGWKIQQPMSFENITHGIPEILTPLFDEFGLKPTYLLSPEVMQNNECVDLLKSIKKAELGTHLHGEFIEPLADWNADRTKTPQLAYSSDIEKEKLKNLTELFESKFGYAAKSFRAGRWGISQKTLSFLEDLNYTVDSSVCSFRTHYFEQGEVNFWGAPLQPYHPNPNDFRKKGGMKILEVPATLGNSDLMKWPKFVLRKLNDKSRIHKKILGKMGKSSKITWFRPWKSSANEMIKIAEDYIQHFASNNKPVVLNMMFHSNEILPGTSPYVQDEKDLDIYLESMNLLFSHLNKNYNLGGLGLSDLKKDI